MAIKVEPRGEDERVQQIISDPKRYFDEARKRARAQIEAEVAERRRRTA